MSTDALRVLSPRLEPLEERVTLSGEVEGARLFWTMPPRDEIALRGEPFVCALLGSAMATGRRLVLPAELPIDATFHANLDGLQEIFARWWPTHRPIVVEADVAARPIGTSGRFTGYSAGVDSSYAVMRLANRLDGVVFLDGVEYTKPNPALAADVDQALRRTMATRGLPMLTVQTNGKWIGKATGGRWSRFIGGTLASVPHALGAADYAIASSNAWEKLRPYGSHPLTDPLWSSAATRIWHQGCDLDRYEKIAALREAPDLLAALRVCFQGNAYNCGRCHKCLKTAAALRALRLTPTGMPLLTDPTLLRTISVEHDDDYLEWQEIRRPALRDDDRPLWRELTRLTSRYEWRQATRRLDELATGGLLRRLLGGG